MNSENLSESPAFYPKPMPSSASNNKITPVVLVCINNVGFNQINHELLSSVFSSYGKINRILIFEKSKKIKAFVEFEDTISAMNACEQLDNFLLFNDGTRMSTYPSNLNKIVFQNNNTGGVDYTLYKEPILKRNISADLTLKKIKFNQNSPRDNEAEDCNRSTSTSTWTKANSGHESLDEDKEDELLKMIESHHKDMKNQDYDDKLSDEEIEKDGFNKLVEDAFVYYPPNNRSSSYPRKLGTSKSFPSSFEDTSAVHYARSFSKENDQSFSNSSQLAGSAFLTYKKDSIIVEENETKCKEFSVYQYNTLSDNYFYDNHGISQNRRFERSMDENEKNFYEIEFEKILKSNEIQKNNSTSNTNRIDLNCLNQLSKDSLAQLYDNLSMMLGKEQDLKKSAVLHVNGLESKEIKITMIYNIFSNFGNVLKIIFMRNKSSALIEFESADYSSVAREYLNNIVFLGKTLRISFSNYSSISIRNKQISKGNTDEVYLGIPKLFRFKKNKMISINPPSSTLHLSNLVKEACVDDSTIKKAFGQYGKIEGLKFLFGEKGKNMCLIKMSTIEESLKAVASLHDTDFYGRKIQISFTRSKI